MEVQEAIRSFSAMTVDSKRFLISASPIIAVVPINIAGTPETLMPYCPAHSCKGLLVRCIMIDFQHPDIQFRVFHLQFSQERFYLLAVAASVAIEKKCSDSRVY